MKKILFTVLLVSSAVQSVMAGPDFSEEEFQTWRVKRATKGAQFKQNLEALEQTPKFTKDEPLKVGRAQVDYETWKKNYNAKREQLLGRTMPQSETIKSALPVLEKISDTENGRSSGVEFVGFSCEQKPTHSEIKFGFDPEVDSYVKEGIKITLPPEASLVAHKVARGKTLDTSIFQLEFVIPLASSFFWVQQVEDEGASTSPSPTADSGQGDSVSSSDDAQSVLQFEAKKRLSDLPIQRQVANGSTAPEAATSGVSQRASWRKQRKKLKKTDSSPTFFPGLYGDDDRIVAQIIQFYANASKKDEEIVPTVSKTSKRTVPPAKPLRNKERTVPAYHVVRNNDENAEPEILSRKAKRKLK